MAEEGNPPPSEIVHDPESFVVPLPPTGLSKVLGLLEVLDDHGGREDIYKLARELRDSFGELIIIIKAAEILNFVETPGGDLVLLPLGKQVIELPVNEKKKIISQQVAKLPLIAHMLRFLAARENHQASRPEVIEELTRVMPTERPKPQFDALVNWGRYSELMTFSRDEDVLKLSEKAIQSQKE
jgi:NitT/TauT family transport system ATP-binding protein